MPIEPRGLWRLLRWAAFAAVVGLGLLALLLLALGRDAFAEAWQPLCDDRDAMLTQIEEGLQQDLLLTGVIPARADAKSGLLSLYANRESGAWTLIVTIAIPEAPSGFGSCVLDAGQGLRLHRPPAPERHPGPDHPDT